MNQTYWQKRFEKIAADTWRTTSQVEKKLKSNYLKAKKEIIKEIYSFYARWGTENGLSYQAAVKDLNSEDFYRWRMSIKQYFTIVNQTGDEALQRELNGLALRSRINQLEELQTRIQLILGERANLDHAVMTQHLTETYQQNVYQSLWALQTGTTVGASFSLLDQAAISLILNFPWSGANYSQRIWGNREKLGRVLQETLLQGFIRGLSNQKMAQELAGHMEASYKSAIRLLRTETTFVSNAATIHGYKESGIVNEYEFLATLDLRTSTVCQHIDGKVFKCEDAKAGVNLPPMHPNCRSTTVPYVGKKSGTRIARGEDRKTYHVPADMTYAEWLNKYVNRE